MNNSTNKNIQDVVAEKEEQLIKHLVDRFLGWRLPDDFHPDAGISFDPVSSKGTEYEHKQEPVGTNLFTAEQAKQMFRFLLENEDGTSALTQLVKEVEAGERERIKKYLRGKEIVVTDGDGNKETVIRVGNFLAALENWPDLPETNY